MNANSKSDSGMKDLAPLTPQQLEQLRKSSSNNRCAECSSQNPPDWAVPNYGISLCIDCAGIHRGLGVHVSFVRSLTMDAWSKDQYDRMIRGGNDKWYEYWKKHASKEEVDSSSITCTMDKKEIARRLKTKYNSDVARSYMEQLSSADEKNGEDLVMSSEQQQSATTTTRAALPDDPMPTLKQYQDMTYSFLMSLLLQAKKPLIAWGVFGIGGAAYAHKLGYKSYVSAGVVAMTACIPYFFIRIGAKKLSHDFLNNRQDAFKSAKNLLMDRIVQGRASRLPNCDVYYPPLPNDGEKRAKMGFVFYPGALVDRTAYAPVATMLSDRGIMVVVANLEPTRLLLSVYNYRLKEKIMRMISDALFNDGGWVVDEWGIGGHSMGCFAAVTAVAKEMSSTIKKVVLYGTGAYPDSTFADCPPLRDATGVKVLVINGSEDAIATSTLLSGPDKERIFREKMPPVLTSNAAAASGSDHGYTIRETIEGGNHAGCASYGPQTFPLHDGIRSITLEEQQKKTAKLTADFLLK